MQKYRRQKSHGRRVRDPGDDLGRVVDRGLASPDPLTRAFRWLGTGIRLFILPLPHVWVIANYKETRMTRVAPARRRE
jgi:hypothetical protein